MEVPVGLGGVCDSPNTFFRESYSNFFHGVRVARTNAVVSERLDLSSSKCSYLQQIHSREMRQTNRHSSREEETCSGTAYLSSDEVSAKLQSAQRTVEMGVSHVNVANNSTNPEKKLSDGETERATDREFAACHSNSQSLSTDLDCCGPDSARHTPKLSPNGDACVANSSTSTTISETARELCNAVSVSLGLAMESNEVSENSAPSLSSDQSERNLFELTLLDSGTESGPVNGAPMTEYRNSTREDPIIGMLKSRPTNVSYMTGGVEILQDPTPSRTGRSDGELGLSTACADFAKDSAVVLDHSRYQFDQMLPSNLTNFSSAEPLPARSASSPLYAIYKPSVHSTDVAETAEGKYSSPCNKKIKSEAMVTEVWGYPYRYPENRNAPYGHYRQTMHPYCSGAQPAFISKSYDYGSGGLMGRERATSEQWYASGMLSRMSYPTSGCLKNDVGQWLDMSSYSDGR